MGKRIKGKKKPKRNIKINTKKEVRGGKKFEKESERNRKISWQFSIMDIKAKWTTKDIEKDFFWKSMFGKIKSYESQTLAEFNMPLHNHRIPKSNICTEARNRLIEINQDDVDELYSIDFNSSKRLWGILDGTVYKILWWDPNHEICLSKKR